MPTLLDYFNNDFKDLSIDTPLTILSKTVGGDKIESIKFQVDINQRLRQEGNSSTRFFTFYIPKCEYVLEVCKILIQEIEKRKEKANEIEVIGGSTGDITIGAHTSSYSNRIYIYTEKSLSHLELGKLDSLGKSMNLFITIRSEEYLKLKLEMERPVAFISHDSRDKELIAKPLVDGLHKRLCIVWYDEYSLQIGASLRESIEKGIKEAKKCVLILTPNYLSNPGWSKKEFSSIFTREMVMNERIVLPIWYNVTKEMVYDYSPSLADCFALKWPNHEGKIEEQYNQEIEQLISRLHTAITIPISSA